MVASLGTEQRIEDRRREAPLLGESRFEIFAKMRRHGQHRPCIPIDGLDLRPLRAQVREAAFVSLAEMRDRSALQLFCDGQRAPVSAQHKILRRQADLGRSAIDVSPGEWQPSRPGSVRYDRHVKTGSAQQRGMLCRDFVAAAKFGLWKDVGDAHDGMGADIIVREFRDGDETAIRDLFRRSFGHELSVDTWRWRYRDHPLGAHRITVAIGEDGALLGHYGGYPVEWRGASARLQSHQNGDVMTAASARRLGRGSSSVLARMAAHYWATYGKGQADFHYGFNTDTARDLQLRIVPDVRVVAQVLTWTLDASASPGPATPSMSVERVTRFTAEWDAFVDRIAHQYPLMATRESRVMNWRYLSQPGTESIAVIVRDAGRIVGGSVFRAAGEDMRWGDALFDLEQPSGLGALFAVLRTFDVPRRIHGWFSAGPERWARMIEHHGFQSAIEPRGLTLVYSPFTVAAERLVPTAYYSWGDSDLF
jgi:hypothetical protein